MRIMTCPSASLKTSLSMLTDGDARAESQTESVVDSLSVRRTPRPPVIAVMLAVATLCGSAAADDRVRPAIERVLPLLERAAAGSAEQRECYTCHHQGLPILALSGAMQRGFTIDGQNLKRQLDHTYAHLERNRDRYSSGEGTGGKADTAGSALWALSAGEFPPDAITSAVAEYLLLWQADDAHWSCTSDRPPSEASDFTTTYLALRGLSAYGSDEQQERITVRKRSAREWLVSTPAVDHEDRVFRLWSLSLTGAEPLAIDSAGADLISRQRADGGWSQLDDLESDAYATATALVALHETARLSTTAENFQRGVTFLLDSQRDDGSWHVASRSKPFQTYFESGFPHGHDQFISCAASAWAVLALLTTLPADEVRPAAAGQGGRYPFEVRETAGIRRRNDVITLWLHEPEFVDHAGGFRLLQGDAVVPIQVRRVEVPGEPTEVVIDFIGHFPALSSTRYTLELVDEPTAGEPTEGLTLTETADAYSIDSSGLVTWTVRKDLAGLLDFSWKETDYIADGSAGLFFTNADDERTLLASRPPARAVVERQGPLATSLVFEYDDWPPGARSRIQLEFPRTKSWIHATWTMEGSAVSTNAMGAELKLRLDGPEALLDFGAGDFVYATVTKGQAARLEAGPRFQSSLPWKVLHGPADSLEPVFTAPLLSPTPPVHGWAHVMDDKRATALAIADFGELERDAIHVDGDGRLSWTRAPGDASTAMPSVRTFEFWLHFVTMPVHIGARTSPRSMQEPLEIVWPGQ